MRWRFVAILWGGVWVFSVCVVAAIAGRPRIPLPDDVPRGLVEALFLEVKFKTVTISKWVPAEERLELFYADASGVVRHVRYVGKELTRTWKSQPLEGQVREIFVEDLDRDGDDELAAYTTKRVYVWDWAEKRSRELWESDDNDFQSVQAMTVASIDADAALEFVICAGNRLLVYDGVNFVREKESAGVRLNPTILLTGNVDRDEAIEIVSNDGFVFGVRALNVEWAAEPFGNPIYLYDLDRDGILEVIGEQRGAVKVWSVMDRHQLW